MIDFRNYLEVNDINDGIDLGGSPDNIFYYGEEAEAESEFSSGWESPFEPIEIGKYKLHLHASENNLCNPMVNSDDPYIYTEWEMMIEETHKKYDMVVVTGKILKKMGIVHPKDDVDITVPMVPTEVIQVIFEYLIDLLYLPKIEGVLPPESKKKE